jgi:pilus assembly protein FimV
MAATGTAGGGAAAAVEEDLIAKDKALKEAQDRLGVLEKNVVELQKLVDMKTQRLAELQQQASGKKEEVKPATSAEPPKPVEPPKVAEPASVVEAPKAAEPSKPAEPPKVAEVVKPVEPQKAPEVKPPEVPKQAAVAPAPESDFDPLPLIGGGLLALLAGYFLFRRRRTEPEPAFTAAVPGPSSLGPNSVFRMTGGQSVDTGNVPLQTGDFSQTGPGTIDTDEVDPVAEADVYMAYGRDAQAEEILIEALRKDPHRTAIHAKLLEIYANRKSVKQFDTLASELYAQTGGVGPEWEKVAVMGAALDSENPLYSGGRSAAPSEAESAAAAAPVDGARATMVLPGTLGAMAATAAEQFAVPELPADVVPETSALGSEEIDFSRTVVSNDVDALDFDLGNPELPLEQVSMQSPEVVESLPEIEAIDFDRGASSPEPFAATEVNPQLPATETLVMGSAAVDNDFSETFIGFEPTMVQQGDLAQSEVGLIDFELDAGVSSAETIVNPAVVHQAMNGELSVIDDMAGMTVDFDADATDFNVKLNESVFIGQPMPVPEFDMTSINLDLGADMSAPTQVVDLSGNFGGDAIQGGQANEEVGTKLALAKAYEEMGDHAQARELLEEVMAEGSGDLVEQAREIIGRLRG